MKIEDYGLKILVKYSIQAPNSRGSATFDENSKIINKTSYDFTDIMVKFHGTKSFALRYKTKNYFILDRDGLKDPCWILLPRGPADYRLWILAVAKELRPFYEKGLGKSVGELLGEIEKTTPFPEIVIEVKR
jgi:hypothetical protein